MQDPIVSISTIRNFMGNAGRNTCNEYLYQALQDADEAMQRQIPKEAETRSNEVSGTYHLCPVCKQAITQGVNYCCTCGQAIKWKNYKK